MNISWRVLALSAVLSGSAPFAHAGIIATLSAGYNGTFDNSVFTITNTSAVTETDVSISTSLAGSALSPDPIDLGSLAAGASITYDFDNPDGGFIVDPVDSGVPDDTLYQLSVNLDGATYESAMFSPLDNLTGGYVDFLGNTCGGQTLGCQVTGSGIVAEIAVPEPADLALLVCPLLVVGALGARRRFQA